MAWEEVEHNTFLPPEAKSVVLADLKDIWKVKHEIKVKYFLPHIDDLEFLSQSPTERVEQDQWKELVTYWKDEDVQKIARKNAINVSKKQCLHRTGRTSFAILKQEMMMKGTDPSTLDVWLESRSRGKGFEDDDTLDLHVPGASSLRQETLSALKDVSSSKEQEVVGERSRKEKFIADYSKAFNIPKKIIAEGVVVGTIGQEGFHRDLLGYVKKAHIPQEKLQRPSKGVTTIGEAVNQCVYWEFVNVMEI
ncbi:UNVERIFIED_CONTAM: hypothetical protein Sradi_2900100 [Sesamum radiatum]|uniref:Transposase n=1 Tax=Sesamum radiatum TaxID=300843 RepID=A0AAW2RYC5_SESRA